MNDAVAGWSGAVGGMNTAAARAGAKWGAAAREYLERYVRVNGCVPFIAPTVRKWAEEHGLPPPPSNYAWGSVFLKASRDGFLIAAGYETYGDRTMHTQSVRVWKRA